MRATPRGGDALEAPVSPARQQSRARHVTVNFESSPIQNVLVFFANWSGKTIIPGSNVTGLITASIQDQPWDVALKGILGAYGFVAREDENGIIQVDNVEDLNKREEVEPIVTQAYRINYATAAEVPEQVTPLLTDRGKVTAGQGTNTLVVNDIQRVQDAVAQAPHGRWTYALPRCPSRPRSCSWTARTSISWASPTRSRTPEATSSTTLSSGAADLNGDGVIDPETETFPQGQAVVLLGGNSIAALGNAKDRLTAPSRLTR